MPRIFCLSWISRRNLELWYGDAFADCRLCMQGGQRLRSGSFIMVFLRPKVDRLLPSVGNKVEKLLVEKWKVFA